MGTALHPGGYEVALIGAEAQRIDGRLHALVLEPFARAEPGLGCCCYIRGNSLMYARMKRIWPRVYHNLGLQVCLATCVSQPRAAHLLVRVLRALEHGVLARLVVVGDECW